MRKLTNKMIEDFKVGNVVFEKDGFVKILAQNGDIIVDWVNEKTLKFAIDNYDELDKACDNFYKELTSKKYTGSNLEKITKAETEYSENDKATLESVNMDRLMGF